MDKKNIFMIVDTKIQFDARVQRSAMALSSRYNITLLSLNSDLNYTNPHFQSIVYTNKYLKGFLLKVVFFFGMTYPVNNLLSETIITLIVPICQETNQLF